MLFSDGVEAPSFGFHGGGVTEAACGRQVRRALSLHPPPAGRSLADFRLTLPDAPVKLVTAVGLRDGAKSNGAGFRVEVNGHEVYGQSVKAGTGWQPVEVDLSAWRGQPMLLTLVTDAEGDFNFDWCVWDEPRLVGQPERRTNGE